MVNHIFNNILIYIIILCVIILYNSYNIIFKIKTIEENITNKNKKNKRDKINKPSNIEYYQNNDVITPTVVPTGARTVSPTGSSTRGRPVSPTGARTISSPVSPTIVARNVVPIIAPTIALSKYTITNPVKEIDNNIDNDIKNNIIIKKYYNSLITDLLKNKLLSLNEVENINLKIKLNITDISDIIESLEKLIKNKPNYNIENELPDDFFSPLGKNVPNKWVDEYTLLNTNKWTVPMRIPPICVNNNLCTVCPLDSANYTTTKNWNNSIYTSNK